MKEKDIRKARNEGSRRERKGNGKRERAGRGRKAENELKYGGGKLTSRKEERKKRGEAKRKENRVWRRGEGFKKR